MKENTRESKKGGEYKTCDAVLWSEAEKIIMTRLLCVEIKRKTMMFCNGEQVSESPFYSLFPLSFINFSSAFIFSLFLLFSCILCFNFQHRTV